MNQSISSSQGMRSRLLAAWQVFCPIHLYEGKKFLSLTLLMSCILYNYNTLRGMKDSIVITAIGAEVISVVKLYGVLPSAFLFMLLYMRLSDYLQQEKIFYIFATMFGSFFLLFAFYLYPYQHQIHLKPERVEQLSLAYPYIKWQIRILANWTFALFYIACELWGSVMLNLLFWSFANHITRTNEAKRYYPLLGFVGNGAIILAGMTIKHISSEGGGSYDFAANVRMVHHAMIFVVIACLMTMIVYYWIHRHILTNPILYTPKDTKPFSKSKRSLWDSLKVVAGSYYLRLISVLVLSYGVSINLVEGPWKAKARELYPSQMEYAQFQGDFLQWQGLVLIPVMLLGSNVIRRLGWFTGAIATPCVIAATGLIFYVFVVFDKAMGDITLTLFHMTPLMLAVYIGMAQNLISKSTKYAMYEPTKEMAYIPIEQELRTKGKSAVDVVGSRMAKSGGALIQSTMFMLFPAASYADITPYLMIFFILIMAVWFNAVKRLHKEYMAHSPEASA